MKNYYEDNDENTVIDKQDAVSEDGPVGDPDVRYVGPGNVIPGNSLPKVVGSQPVVLGLQESNTNISRQKQDDYGCG